MFAPYVIVMGLIIIPNKYLLKKKEKDQSQHVTNKI